MYIYDLPFELNRELCRLLDNDDVWKELADHMSYKAFEVNVSDFNIVCWVSQIAKLLKALGLPNRVCLDVQDSFMVLLQS